MFNRREKNARDNLRAAGGWRNNMTIGNDFDKLSFSGNVGAALFDDRKNPAFCFNENREFDASGVIKLFILGALLERWEKGDISLIEEIEIHNAEQVSGTGVLKDLSEGFKMRADDIATLMIIASDNVAANLIIDRLGGVDAVNEHISGAGLKKTVLNRKITFGAEKKPLGITTPMETAIYLLKIFENKTCDFFIDILKKQNDNVLFTRKARPPIIAAHKTGVSESAANDAGYFIKSSKTYVFSVFTSGAADKFFSCDSEAAIYLGNFGELFAAQILKS
jgi:beta-lactamase class A